MITFEEATHTYRDKSGAIWPSVTTILKPVYDFANIDPTVLENKAALGTYVHKASELIDEGRLDWSAVIEPALPYCRAYEKFMREVDPMYLGAETLVYHTGMRFAGTFDRLALIGGVLTLIDIKTVAVLSAAVGVQLAAYEKALLDCAGTKVEARAALQLMPNGNYRLVPFNKPNDWTVFVALKTVWNFAQEKSK
jgi:hypothetical protein